MIISPIIVAFAFDNILTFRSRIHHRKQVDAILNNEINLETIMINFKHIHASTHIEPYPRPSTAFEYDLYDPLLVINGITSTPINTTSRSTYTSNSHIIDSKEESRPYAITSTNNTNISSSIPVMNSNSNDDDNNNNTILAEHEESFYERSASGRQPEMMIDTIINDNVENNNGLVITKQAFVLSILVYLHKIRLFRNSPVITIILYL